MPGAGCRLNYTEFVEVMGRFCAADPETLLRGESPLPAAGLPVRDATRDAVRCIVKGVWGTVHSPCACVPGCLCVVWK